MRRAAHQDDQDLLGLLLLQAERHSLDGRLSPKAALVVGHLSGLVDRWIEPVASARTKEELERVVDEAMMPVFEGVLALTFVVLADLRRPVWELGRELVEELRPEGLATAEQRLGPDAYGNTLQALHSLRNALVTALHREMPAPTPELLRPYVRLLVALAALQREDLSAPDLLALFAREQASEFSRRLKALTRRPAAAEPRGAVVSDPSDLAYARAAMRAWLARSGDGRETAAR